MFDLWRKGRIISDFDVKIDENDPLTFCNIKKHLGNSNDVIYKDILINERTGLSFPIVYIEGLVNVELFDKTVLMSMRFEDRIKSSVTEEQFIENTISGSIYHINSTVKETLKDTINEIFNGSIVLICDNSKKALIFDVKGFMMRGLSEPSNEAVIKGPKSAFIEILRMNTALVRRCIRSTDLKIDAMTIGEVSTIPICIFYMDSIVDKKMLDNIKQKLQNIKCNNLINAGEFEERMTDNKNSLFPQMIITERPDKFCSNLMDGKIGIIIDGLPTAFILPAVFNMFFQSTDDYSNNWLIASFVRIIRYSCMAIALFFPAFYISILCFHPELLNNSIALAIIKGKEDVPLTTIQEVIFLTLAFEILLEAGIRMPKTIGQTVPIIGGLIVGEAAVSAKILTPSVVIVAAITGIAGFMIPNQDFLNTTRLCRFIFIICASLAGFFGLSVGIMLFLYYLCGMESFGVPYMVPFVANNGKFFLNDTLIRRKIKNK